MRGIRRGGGSPVLTHDGIPVVQLGPENLGLALPALGVAAVAGVVGHRVELA